MRNASKILVRKPERKRPLGRHRYRWEDNIKIEKVLRKIGTGCFWLSIRPVGL
jgi:hypothetical protein